MSSGIPSINAFDKAVEYYIEEGLTEEEAFEQAQDDASYYQPNSNTPPVGG